MYLTVISANKVATVQYYIAIPGLIYLKVQFTGCFAICGSPGNQHRAFGPRASHLPRALWGSAVQKSSVIWEQSWNSTQGVNGRYFHVSFKVLATYRLFHQPFLSPASSFFFSELACLKPSSWPHHGHILNGVRLLRTPAALGVTPDSTQGAQHDLQDNSNFLLLWRYTVPYQIPRIEGSYQQPELPP